MSKYHKTIKGVTMDVYDVLRAFEVTSPAIQHAVKKLLMPGVRGHKDQLQDVQEAAQSIQREIEYLTSIEPEKTIKEQLLEAVIDRSWLRADLFQPKNPDYLYDVRTYGGQEFRSEPLHKWTFGDSEDQNSVAEWRETIEPAKLERIHSNDWIKYDGMGLPVDDKKLVEVQYYNGRMAQGTADSFGWFVSRIKSQRDWCIELYRELTNEAR
jgi:hypothetical protein